MPSEGELVLYIGQVKRFAWAKAQIAQAVDVVRILHTTDRELQVLQFFLCEACALALGDFLITHDTAVASSLLEQRVPKEVIATVLTRTEANEQGKELLTTMGIQAQTPNGLLPFIAPFHRASICYVAMIAVLISLILFAGTLSFFRLRKQLYAQAEQGIAKYIGGDYSVHLPQNSEGAIFQIFASVEQLATMLQAKNESEQNTKVFLKNTISDISHQLKTPLAALAIYQEIIENEADHAETVMEFSAKMGLALKRMEQLIQSMLKITRLDTGNIVFEKAQHKVTELISHAIHALTTRAEHESKKLLIDGTPGERLICDMEWTGEAIGNIVKNALDHTKPGGTIRITWEHTPAMLGIFISDDGNGIAPEDIHHIFKRFYRSKHALDTQGIGLGLPLAKSIIEGQGGLISVQSEWNAGTTFTLSFLTES